MNLQDSFVLMFVLSTCIKQVREILEDLVEISVQFYSLF